MTTSALQAWHRIVESGDSAGLADLLAEDAVFHSPVVHTPQVGRPLVTSYLQAATQVLGNDSFRYVREIVGHREAALEFEVEVDGIHINGVDLIRWNDDERICDFKVMVRPLKAIGLLHEKMRTTLEAAATAGRAGTPR
jgi:hypothetical protein